MGNWPLSSGTEVCMRSLRRVVAVILVGGVAVGLASRSAGSVHAGPPHPREVLFTYQARLTQLPQQADTIDVWIPLAKTTREQQILRRQVHASIPYPIAQDQEYDNDILHLSLQRPLPEVVEVSIDYQARLGPGEDPLADPPAPADELARELTPRGLGIVDEEVRTRAGRATVGRTTPMDRARGIYEAVLQQVKYDKSVPGWGRGDTRRGCLLGAGNCTDFHSLFISMARSSRIPARFKIGVVIPPPDAPAVGWLRRIGGLLKAAASGGGMIPQETSGTLPGYHCWAEFYMEGRGWVPVDASEAWKHPELADYYFGARDPNRLLISRGRDIQLVPRQRGGPINIFFYPYVEIDGRVFDQVETELSFQELKREGAA